MTMNFIFTQASTIDMLFQLNIFLTLSLTLTYRKQLFKTFEGGGA